MVGTTLRNPDKQKNPQSVNDKVASIAPSSALMQSTEADLVQLRDNASGLQADVIALRERAFERLQTLGFPTRRNENWKYQNLASLLGHPLSRFNNAEVTSIQADAVAPYRIAMTAKHNAFMVFVDGVYASDLSTLDAMPTGTVVSDLETALTTHSERVMTLLSHNVERASQLKNGVAYDGLMALNATLFGNGLFVDVPENSTDTIAVQAVFLNTGAQQNTASYVRNVIAVGAQSDNVTVVMQSITLPNVTDRAVSLTSVLNEVSLAASATLNLVSVQNEDAPVVHVQQTITTQAEKSNLQLNTFGLGTNVSRHAIQCVLDGEEAETHLNGLAVLNDTAEAYNNVWMHHNVGNCHSTQLYKNIVDGRSKAEFNGTVVVERDANGTDSHQLSKTLMLSDDAKVFTRPQLQIDADDVKCAHGATVGQLEEDELFYMASRGIDAELAECLLTYGFAEDVISKVGNTAIETYLDQWLLSNLNQSSNPLLCDVTCDTCEVTHD